MSPAIPEHLPYDKPSTARYDLSDINHTEWL